VHLRTVHVKFGLFRGELGMTKLIARDAMYRRRSFDADIIELCVPEFSLSVKTPTMKNVRTSGDPGT
jgi:hypothetical protein